MLRVAAAALNVEIIYKGRITVWANYEVHNVLNVGVYVLLLLELYEEEEEKEEEIRYTYQIRKIFGAEI